ncbi:glycoside hydrolase family protein [Carboxylicivirga caseinilyticus]|uniref:glycoside hydrolase family protein n=1 Tax=Carboxylicivirga caseinilyticus TaxID=3417572 RepID=UPI003D33A365|nr:glycoside hydrolase family protein [Marinilabiliaceae bacterium A049]
MNKAIFFFTLALTLSATFVHSQVTERKRPDGWEKLVLGGRFMDRFLPMPHLGGMTTATWGADCVIPRDTANGIEEDEWSYWGGNTRLGPDGKYHLFVCRWAENSPRGHMEWGNSNVVHAVSDHSCGPFKVVQEIGKGHNPEWYITNSGKYVIYVIGGYYISDDINGPWERKEFTFDTRDRGIIEGLSNLTFAKREDGSFIMICRGGGVWVSKDGLSAWNQITDSRVYPPVDGRFEDPLIWKTNVQYHLIVNDWLGRIAWYLRSKDGIHWKVDSGEAYLPGIASYADGTKEDWFKYERIKVMQDEYGRAAQANFAVIDTLKYMDLPNDNHSSKLITIPLSVGKLLTVQNKKPITTKTKEIKLLIQTEKGFDPNTDIDLESVRFGAPEVIDIGMGCKLKNIQPLNDGAILTFDGQGNGFSDDNFAGKLLGKDKQGKLLFGYSKLPGVENIEAALSARKPVYSDSGMSIDIENFGQVNSAKASVKVFLSNNKEMIEVATGTIPTLKPYERKTIELKTKSKQKEDDQFRYLVIINKDKKNEVTFNTKSALGRTE